MRSRCAAQPAATALLPLSPALFLAHHSAWPRLVSHPRTQAWISVAHRCISGEALSQDGPPLQSRPEGLGLRCAADDEAVAATREASLDADELCPPPPSAGVVAVGAPLRASAAVSKACLARFLRRWFRKHLCILTAANVFLSAATRSTLRWQAASARNREATILAARPRHIFCMISAAPVLQEWRGSGRERGRCGPEILLDRVTERNKNLSSSPLLQDPKTMTHTRLSISCILAALRRASFTARRALSSLSHLLTARWIVRAACARRMPPSLATSAAVSPSCPSCSRRSHARPLFEGVGGCLLGERGQKQYDRQPDDMDNQSKSDSQRSPAYPAGGRALAAGLPLLTLLQSFCGLLEAARKQLLRGVGRVES